MKDVANLDYLKTLNRLKVLNLIRENQEMSRQELAKLTGLTPAAITGIVRELVQMGNVIELGPGESSGGRRPIKLKFNPEAGYVIGVEITRNRTTLGIVDLQAKPIKIIEASINMSNPQEGLLALKNCIDRLINETEIPAEKIMGAGFALPGLYDRKDNSIKHSPNLGEGWRNAPIRDWLQDVISVPFFIEHNSNAAALAEYTLGQGKHVKDLAYVNLGEGLSAGVIMDDRILYGSRGYAGEMGHVVIVENGPLCNCGNKGCLESLYAVPALVRKANNELPLCSTSDSLKQIWESKGQVTIEDIITCASDINSYAWELIKQAGWYMGTGVANLINFYNPEMVVLGGILAGAGSVLMEPLIESMHAHAFPEISKNTRVEISLIGRQAAFYGACLVGIKKLFSNDRTENIYSMTVI
ncbi:ROK family transcriptional regulator [Desulfosporosinus sp. SYSU MS00001]|uniref:ROK family transcriptional regulator n=1 Tax=Desulfosporosinus sp. SYSU MS00001 TaxID=3416284 RepID=UPI003CEF5DBF